jgi:phage shock protein PspC (stress-responsive transcriptional regulator)
MTTPPVQPSAPESSSQGPWFNAPTAPPPPPPPTGANGFWDEVGRLGVVRDRGTGWLGGVCAGLAHRLGVDPLLVRALAIVLVFAGGFGLVAYLVAWLILPDTLGGIPLRDIGEGSVTGILLVVALVILLASGISFGERTWLGGWFVPLAAIAIFFLVRNGRRTDGQQAMPPTGTPPGAVPPPVPYGSSAPAPYAGGPAQEPTTPSVSKKTPMASYAAPAPARYGALTYAPPGTPGAPLGPSVPGPGAPGGTIPPVPPVVPRPLPPRPQRRPSPRGSGAIVLGLAVIGYGLGFLLDGPIDINGSPHFLGLLIALGFASLGALALGLAGRRGGAASVLTVLLILPVGVSALIEKAPFPDRATVVTWAPTGSAGYNIGAGSATLDLSTLVPTDTTTAPEHYTLTVSVGVGELVVLVPDGVDINLDSSVGLGSSDLGAFVPTEGRVDGVGSNRSASFSTAGTDPARAVIDLNINVGLGDLTLREK